MALPIEVRAESRPIFRDWKNVFRELNSGQEPQWRSQGEAETWLRENVEEVEPLVLRILRGERPDTPWTKGLITARVIATPAVAALLTERLREALSSDPGMVVRFDSPNSYIIAIIEVLERALYAPALGLVHRIVVTKGQDSLVLERSADYLRRVGDEESIAIVKEACAHDSTASVANRLELSARIIEARIHGRDFFENAEDDLRAVERAWMEALEAKDRDAYARLLPSVARGRVEVGDYWVELLGSPDLPRILEAVRNAAGREVFEIDRDKLEASMIVDGRYKFLYALEVDGWKTGGPIQIAP